MLIAHVAQAGPDPAARKRAGELATEAAQHYRRGELEVSAALLRKAYSLYPEPNLLYNLARSLEGSGDKPGAIEAYEKYLATAKYVADRGAIERRLATLKAELADKPAKVVQEPAKPVQEPAKAPDKPVAEAPAPPPDPSLTAMPLIEPFAAPPGDPPETQDDEAPTKLPWLVIGGGVALFGGGLICGAVASDRHDQAVKAPVAADAKALQDSADHYALLANILFVAGGAAAIGGAVWEIRERTASRSPRVARARIGPGTVSLEVTW